jgi:ubiquinone/menaquinone biosynthesis C-methylase UbiE
MNNPSYFDRRAPTYDQSEIHHRVVSLLLEGTEIAPGASVLDIATGTGLLALAAARKAGPTGKVIGIDLSPGMLAEARLKAAERGMQVIDFLQEDAERLPFPPQVFDFVFAASAIVFMSDIPRALRHWRDVLKPRGVIAFDTPAKPFGLSQTIAEIAAAHGIHLAYATIADTAEKCRALLTSAGYEVLDVRTERAATSPMELGKAIAFWDERLEHPAWHSLTHASAATRAAVRSDYVASVTAAAVDGFVPNETALNFVFGRKTA